jgi:hypothetical protein
MGNEIKTDKLGLPIIDDRRSYEQRVGAQPNFRRVNSTPTVMIANHVPQTILDAKTGLNASERALRSQNRKLALDHSATIISNLLDLALTSPNDMVRVKASEILLVHGLGRPPMPEVDHDGSVTIPQFTIIYGTTETIEQFEVKAQIEEVTSVEKSDVKETSDD